MTSFTYFASPFNTAAHLDIKQVNFYEKTRKRKRSDPEDAADANELTSSSYHEGPYSSADELAKGSVLAQESDYSQTFPHTPSKSDRTKSHVYTRSELAKELASMKPPLQPASGPKVNGDTGLKQQHLGVLTTLMHTCLMKGDYIRAGRAWGLLLRAEVKGHPMDLRSNGLWGLGAEILLQRDLQVQKTRYLQDVTYRAEADSGSSGGLRGTALNADREVFTDNGFRAAKEYFNRLVVQYRFNKNNPEALSDLHFYQAMFSLWISHLHDKQQDKRTGLSRGPQASSNAGTDAFAFEGGDATESNATRDLVGKSTLQEAHEIAEQLDGLLVSFPYSGSLQLWNLRGMLALWMRDLCLPASRKQDMAASTGNRSGSISPRRVPVARAFGGSSMEEHRSAEETGIEVARIHQEKAEKAFERVKELEKHSNLSLEEQDSQAHSIATD